MWPHRVRPRAGGQLADLRSRIWGYSGRRASHLAFGWWQPMAKACLALNLTTFMVTIVPDGEG